GQGGDGGLLTIGGELGDQQAALLQVGRLGGGGTADHEGDVGLGEGVLGGLGDGGAGGLVFGVGNRGGDPRAGLDDHGQAESSQLLDAFGRGGHAALAGRSLPGDGDNGHDPPGFFCAYCIR